MSGKGIRRHLAAGVVIVVLLLAATSISAGAGFGLLRVSFIDVGQGDSILMRADNGFDALVDGGRPSAGPTVVAYLHQLGVDSLEVMIATHADSDHIGGLIDVLNTDNIEISQVLYNGYPGDTATWDDFAHAVQRRGISLMAAQFPAEYNWDTVTAHVLNPASGLSNPD